MLVAGRWLRLHVLKGPCCLLSVWLFHVNFDILLTTVRRKPRRRLQVQGQEELQAILGLTVPY